MSQHRQSMPMLHRTADGFPIGVQSLRYDVQAAWLVARHAHMLAYKPHQTDTPLPVIPVSLASSIVVDTCETFPGQAAVFHVAAALERSGYEGQGPPRQAPPASHWAAAPARPAAWGRHVAWLPA